MVVTDDGVVEIAPPVVAVVVAAGPGPWFEECLRSLGAQDYRSLSVLVIDDASSEPVLSRVAAILPSAYVRRLDEPRGFAAAADISLELVSGASFLLLCHDDVRLAPDAVALLVEEAFRSNGGIVGPKLVRWGEPERLLSVGLTADKTGVTAASVEPGELDQAQHDAVREVFAVPGACALVRADLLATLHGHDPVIPDHGEDLDLCWRAQVAGARVVVAPGARVEHREAAPERPNRGEGHAPAPREVEREARRGFARHRLRTTLVCYGAWHLLRVLPQAGVATAAAAVVALVNGRARVAADLVGAWPWNLRRLGSAFVRRRQLRRVRTVSDAEVRRLQTGGSTGLRSWFRGDAGGAGRRPLGEVSRSLADRVRSPSRVTVLAVAVVGLLLLVGSRRLLFDPLPVVGGFVPFDEGPLELLGQYLDGWRRAGVGSGAPPPTALGLLGLGGLATLGATGVLRTLLVLGALPVGVLGAWRLSRPLQRRSGRVVAVVAYATVALPYDSLAGGSWAGLLLYAAAPPLLGRILRAGEAGLAEADEVAGDAGRSAPEPPAKVPPLVAVAGLGLLTAVVAAFVPPIVLLVPVVALAATAGRLVAGERRGALVMVATGLGAGAIAAVAHLPWASDLLSARLTDPALLGVAGPDPSGHAVTAFLRFDLGPTGSVLGWALPVAAALPLLVASGRRLALAGGAWGVAIACWALAVASDRGDLGGLQLPPEILLAPGAAALALAAGAGFATFEEDVRSGRFGWRQAAAVVAAGSVVVGVLPVAVATAGGRWHLPDDDLSSVLAPLAEGAASDGGRVLWLGEGDVLPAAGQRLDASTTLAVSDGFRPHLGERWSADRQPVDRYLASALRRAAGGETERLGRLLAPVGIRWVVAVSRPAPERAGGRSGVLPDGLVPALASQLDLAAVPVDPAVAVFENQAWFPERVSVPVEVVATVDVGDPLRAAAGLDLAGLPPALPGSARRGSGRLEAGGVLVAEAASDRWSLEIDGEEAPSRTSFGWAASYSVPVPGDGRLRHHASATRVLALVGQALGWVALLVVARGRRLGRRPDQVGGGGPERLRRVPDPEPLLGPPDARGVLASVGARRDPGASEVDGS